MKPLWIVVVCVGVLVLQAFAAEEPKKDPFPSIKEKASYAIGVSVGASIKGQSLDVDLTFLLKGIQETLEGKAALNQKDAMEAIRAYQGEASKRAGEKNKKDGEAFLAENKVKEGVETLPSGLQYKVVTAGAGEKPKATDTVKTHYRGTLIDGTEFDSSYSRNEPATFPVNGVIKGWTEALQLMGVGSKWMLFVPSNLAYGERGSPPRIGPNSTLIFEVELLAIE
jgi:FKBP-type peptidyl-prolyl cis-trans isomerase FklB